MSSPMRPPRTPTRSRGRPPSRQSQQSSPGTRSSPRLNGTPRQNGTITPTNQGLYCFNFLKFELVIIQKIFSFYSEIKSQWFFSGHTIEMGKSTNTRNHCCFIRGAGFWIVSTQIFDKSIGSGDGFIISSELWNSRFCGFHSDT